MKNLADAFNDTPEIDALLIKEYFERNERKKKDEAWLKENGAAIKAAMKNQGKEICDYDDLRVSITIPDASHFDMDKVLTFLKYDCTAGIYNACTKTVVDEKALEEVIAYDGICLDKLKSHTWVKATGSPRLSITKKKASKKDDT